MDATSSASPRPPAPVAGATPDWFTPIYDEHFAFVWRNLRRLGVDPASLDDAVQEVFLVLYRRGPEVVATSLRGWLFGVARRVAAATRRGTRRRDAVTEALRVEPAASADRRDILAAQLVGEVIGALDPDRRDVFILAELEQWTAAEIADALAIPINTVYSRLRLARAEFDTIVTRRTTRGGLR